jgi:soluble lytic murein transglycosylase-like protein
MRGNDPAARHEDLVDLPLRSVGGGRDPARPRTIVIRHGQMWQSVIVFFLCLLLLALVLLAHQVVRGVERREQAVDSALARVDRRIQAVEAGIDFDSDRRRLLLGMRDHILRVNPRVSVGDAYRYAAYALQASEKYPAVDPLLLVAIGTVESQYDTQAVSKADARGLYQIWPSTGRLLFRSLGWDYDEASLHDPQKNTEAAALYLDILFTAYEDPQMVLAEYNGGPLNAGYFRAGVSQLASETRNYVPQVLDLYKRLKDQFAAVAAAPPDALHRDPVREGKALAGPPSAGISAERAARRAAEKADPAEPQAPAAPRRPR